MGLQFNTSKAQSVLASRTDEAEAMKKAARVAVQAEAKLELETALAHQRSQHEAATTAAAAAHAELLRKRDAEAAAAADELQTTIGALRRQVESGVEERMAAEAAARAREDELRAAMAQAGRQHDALLARERGGGRAQQAELTVGRVHLECLETELRAAERQEQTALGSAVAALEESGAGAAELTSLRQEKVELVAKVETTSEQLAEVTETHGASEASHAIAARVAATLAARRHAAKVARLMSEHEEAVAALRRRHDASSAAKQREHKHAMRSTSLRFLAELEIERRKAQARVADAQDDQQRAQQKADETLGRNCGDAVGFERLMFRGSS